MSAGISLMIDSVSHLFSKEKMTAQKAQEMAKRAITSGADTGAKTAMAAAIKVASEKGILPKAFGLKNVFVAIGTLVVDHLKVLWQFGKGEITSEQAIEKLHENSLSTIAGIVFAAAGEYALMVIGAIFGSIGMAVGGFIGATLGYMAGSAVGQKIAEASKSLVSSVVSGIKTAISFVGNAVKSVASGIKSVFSAVVGAFS
ncbi:hypothetical protein [Helicobacter bizzozeronii]|nr:hypothetical protein [Helicobacter bizzozeronii]